MQDETTLQKLQGASHRLALPKSEVVREPIAEFHRRKGRLSERERVRMLRAFDELAPQIPRRSTAELEGELAAVRETRRTGGRVSRGCPGLDRQSLRCGTVRSMLWVRPWCCVRVVLYEWRRVAECRMKFRRWTGGRAEEQGSGRSTPSILPISPGCSFGNSANSVSGIMAACASAA